MAGVWDLATVSPAQAVQFNKHGGRVEQRSLWASQVLVGYSDWPHLAQVCRLEPVITRKGQSRPQVAYAVTSLPAAAASPKWLLTLWRGHWGIENRLHWVRDVTFDEDRCQIRSGAPPQVMAALRNLVISLSRLAGHTSIAAALRHYAAHPIRSLQLSAALPCLTFE